MDGTFNIGSVDLTGVGHPIGGGIIRISDGCRLSFQNASGVTRKWYGADLLPAGTNVVTGTAYGAGDYTASYPTTATSKAAQYVTDQAAVVAAGLDHIDRGTTILEQEGTGMNAADLAAALTAAKVATTADIVDAKSIAAALTGYTITLESTVLRGGRLQIYRGDAMTVARGNPITAGATTWPDLDNATLEIRFFEVVGRTTADTAILTIIQTGATGKTASIEMTTDETATLTKTGQATYRAVLSAVWGEGDARALAFWTVDVYEGRAE
jgi:hypothetical protein